MAEARTLDAILSSIPDANRWKLDQEIDFEHRDARGQVTPQHLGRIAEPMVDWEGAIADHLGLSEANRKDIKDKNPREPAKQRYVVKAKLENIKLSVICMYAWQERGAGRMEVSAWWWSHLQSSD